MLVGQIERQISCTNSAILYVVWLPVLSQTRDLGGGRDNGIQYQIGPKVFHMIRFESGNPAEQYSKEAYQ